MFMLKDERYKLNWDDFNNEASQFEIAVSALEKNDGTLLLEFEYTTDLFKAETIERLSAHFRILLAGIVANPAQLSVSCRY